MMTSTANAAVLPAVQAEGLQQPAEGGGDNSHGGWEIVAAKTKKGPAGAKEARRSTSARRTQI
jgi:hypothetical protein